MDLLTDATIILNRLQAFSVDMAHIFTPKSEDALWNKYYNGDKAVFMRHITKMITESQNKKITEFYRQNEDFRVTVGRYMSEFEEMTKKAQEGEESKLLMSVLIGSDVGRLYMVLADVLKMEL
jgi:predicted metallo-beta-lactamase superfamily hydrolase